MIPVLQDKDGIYKTFYNPQCRRFVEPPRDPLGLSVRSFSSLAQLKQAYPRQQLVVTSKVVPNTKVAPEVPQEKIESMQRLYDEQPAKDIPEIPEEMIDKLADRILQRLEEKLSSSASTKTDLSGDKA